MNKVHELQIDASTADEAKKYIDRHYYRLGKIYSIAHSRDKRKGAYKTTLKGTIASITVNGGLSSGCGEEGDEGLVSILEKVGITTAAAERVVKGNCEETHNFTLLL